MTLLTRARLVPTPLDRVATLFDGEESGVSLSSFNLRFAGLG